MAILVTRPHPDDEATAAGLRARGFKVLLAPMLRFEPVAFHDDADADYGAVIVTSANGLRGIEPYLAGTRLLKLPLFAVGAHTASAAHRAGFDNVIPADGDAAGLRDSVLASVKAKRLKKASTLLYLAGADLAPGSKVEAVLHYSRRSARAFLDAARSGGVEISALAIPQCCISGNVASVVRDAGATQVMVAASSDENALFELLDRALRAVSR